MNTVETTPATLETSAPARYFRYTQNNSGGSFDIDDVVAQHVIIQAHSASEANSIAKIVGIYFNGCDEGIDCRCCGDRWYEAGDGKGTDTPLIYGEDPTTYNSIFTAVGEPVCHVYHLDGSKTTYRKAAEQA